MKKKDKALLLASGAAVLVAGSVLGTLAFLTDTEQAVNTFTVGNVQISLAETDVDEDGNVLENEYKLVPGGKYTKDPTITVEEGSEESYVRMILKVYNPDGVEQYGGIDAFIGDIGTEWIIENDEGTEGTDEEGDAFAAYEYRYSKTVDGADGELTPLFKTLSIPSDINGDQLKALVDDGFKIVVEGHAIQASGFENNEDGAWDAFDAQLA